ncbi:MAG: LEA type 2 family protein [Steroidobacteraceae bacterium]
MRILWAAALLLVVSACAATRFETPKLQVVGIEMQRSELFDQRFKVRLRVQNPNDRALPVKGISATMDLNGEEFAHGVAGEAFTVPAFGEAEFDMLLSANMAGAILRLVSGMRDGKAREALEYRVRGKLSLSSGLLRSIPFEETGSFRLGDLKGAPRP